MDITKMTNTFPAVFLDRDGTIVEDKGNVSNIQQIEFYPFAFDVMKQLQKKYKLFIVTNQSSIGLGKVTLEQATIVNNYVLSELKLQGVSIEALYCCSHKRDDGCACIKPKPYFLRKAEKEHSINLDASFTIGDHPHDVEFGRSVGATGLYVLTGHGKKHFSDLVQPTEHFDNLELAAKRILNN